ncbi:hypothetical protein MKX03_016638 [Papaver bracteatum]|nr:hypothetical protein MKX03_016638 [Papaver bracteatum]
MIYGSTGATHFDQLAKIFTGYEMTGAPSSGFLFKITAVPFHMWAPDIYEGSPTPVTAFLSIAPKISISANMSRLSIYGALAAMAQTKVKRLLAHSSIGHVGYICTGLGQIELKGALITFSITIKFYLFFAALGCGAYFLASVGIVTSVIGCIYYIRLVKRMFFDTPKTWILYEPMDRNKSLLLAMTSSFITSSFPYPSPLFSVTHQMVLSSYL